MDEFSLTVSDCKENLIELRIIVSTEAPADIDKLRCEIREKLLNFINKKYPESLPKYRIIPFEMSEKKLMTETE